ncbi:hypothetical protein IP86_10740 [Rhodopseudomonas sp. AAP120]|uniref:phage major tail tube protein n=1 Tax=Rhodopseudomonas sp. AAP120 TaxID=1523430 RepID=UPI0006BA04E8|nr:phage major tail tube protein [Rhodopseudomonas sp. AAP120]KPF98800.1 hypothetical protein IP86_10740 [Rhodopseudomonas sp. AAP120]
MEFVRKAGNLYAEGINTWLSLASYKLPQPKAITEDHLPGGGIMKLDVPIGAIEQLKLQFNLKGAPPSVLGQFGLSLGESKLYTVYELMVDEMDGTRRERIITMRGLFQESDPDEMKGRGVNGYAYHIGSITDYEDVIEGYGIIAAYRFKTNMRRGYLASANSDLENRILRITG